MTVQIANLDFSYGHRPALRDVTASALNGRVTAVLGPNAAGKSTLLRCIIGAVRPQRGRVTVDDLDAASMSPRALAAHLAYVPQRAVVSATFTVRQVVELGRYALPPSSDRIDDALQRLELRELEERPYTELSVGQQQRVTLARAVAQLKPQGNLILDEPASAMDLRHVRNCFGLLRKLADAGALVMLAMHDLGLAADVADDVWLLRDGRLAAAGPALDVLTAQRLQAVFESEFEWIRDRTGQQRLVTAAMNRAAPEAGR